MKITLNNPHRNHFFGYVTAAVCLTAPLVSQPSLAADSEQLQEILVSASLLPIARSRSASAVSVIDREQLKNRLALDVSDLLRDVPGMSVSRSGVMGSQTQVRMRGAEANHVLVLIDGIEANDPSLGDETSWASLSAADVQRIEVLRGPQSALYGSDAMAGVISIETTRASQGSTAQLFSEAGSFSTHRSGVAVGHAARDYNIRLSASHLETDGDNIARSGDEKDGYRNTTINFTGALDLSRQLKASLTARDHQSRNQFDADDDYDGLVEDRDRSTDADSTMLGLALSYKSVDNLWRHRLALSEVDFDNHNFNAGASDGTNASTKTRYQYVGSRVWDNLQQQLSFLAEAEREDYRQAGGYAYGSDADTVVERKTESFALEYRLDPSEQLTLGISGRHDGNDRFDDADTYRLEALYRLSERTQLRSTYATAIKNPTFTELFGIFSGFAGNPELQPESSKSWSLGVDHSAMGGDLSVSLNFYTARLEDEIKTVYAPDYSSSAENFSGESQRDGIELASRMALTPELVLTAAYTYTDATETDSASAEVKELRRPKHTASLNVAWRALPNLLINTNAQYNGSQADLYFPPWPTPMETVTMEAYTLVAVHANYSATRQLDIYLKVDNLLDEDYEDVFGYQTLGLGARVGARYNF